MRRRDLLRASAPVFASATTTALAGCTGGDGDEDATTARSTTTDRLTPDTTTRTDATTDATVQTDATTDATADESTTDARTGDCQTLEAPTAVRSQDATTTDAGPSLASRVASGGHFAWFARSAEYWGRQSTPYDRQVECSRWTATPTSDGGLDLFVQGIDVSVSPQSAGFDLHLGRLGDVDAIRIDSRVVREGRYATELALALYLDEDENGEFFEWTTTGDGPDRWEGFGGDEEAADTVPIEETVVIDDDFNFRLLNRDSAEATLGELKRGEIQYYSDDKGRDTGENRGIGADTNAAIYVGLVDTGHGAPVEVVAEDVTIERP